MKMLVIPTRMLATLAVMMTVCAPVLAPVTAEAARRGVAACGPRGCGAAACGPRGCAAVGRRTAPVVRPPVRRGVVVVTPRRYWRPGTAIAAGAAIGFVAGAAAVSLAGSPPQSGQCWYYTSPAKTTGFWDVCPR
ncbi:MULTISPECIES: hypothetical protein [Rhizobium]|uniref:hypothetical protein n=1 Tax=Rhizobium TaxID=379 RepID=UPI00103D0491|nr:MULTISPECIES: hypothetical protein [Rhizobium]KAF5884431.1 hypothetical protein FY112_15905 [Rhizobium sp. PEPV16]MBY5777273.1 hypothetical protein [Rhizobium leguminosarum]NKL96365.1 hypothetical protein [Rhizobium leguminosarum bv. viciae]TBZ08332.1 hypothetical protein E0H38_28195 [Rhizobium leguminosarum bv. viciae]